MTAKLIRNCREVTALVLQGQDRAWAWHERLALRLHWSVCRHCRRFRRQAALMQQAMGRWRAYREDAGADEAAGPASGTP